MSITKTREVFSLPNVHYAENPDFNAEIRIFYFLNSIERHCFIYTFIRKNNNIAIDLIGIS